MIPAATKETKKCAILCPWTQTFGEEGQTVIYYGIKEMLTLAKFQGIYFFKIYLDFEADAEEGAYGIGGGGTVLEYSPEDKYLSLTIITDLNML